MIIERFPAVQQLTYDEKLQLVGELWDDVAADPAKLPVDPEVFAELERRMAEYHAHPASATTWEAVKERIRLRRLQNA